MRGSRIPAPLRTRIGDEATFGLIELLDTERRDWSDNVLTTASDRFERRLALELGDLRQEMATTRVEMLRWSFLFWIGQVATVAGLLAYMLRR